MRKIINSKKSFLFLVLAMGMGSSSPAMQVKRIGLLWIENSSNSESHRQEILLKIKDWVENGLGARLVSSHPRVKIPPQIIRLEEKKQDLLNYVAETDGAGVKIDRKKALLPKGIFGPELQWIKIYQAKFWWKKKNLKKMEQLLLEARQLHPSGELSFLGFKSELQRPDWEVFEAVVNQWDSQNPILSKCSFKRVEGKKNIKISGNGFVLNERLDFLQPGIFLFDWDESNGERSIQIIRCIRNEVLILGQGAKEKADQLGRIESFFRRTNVEIDSYLVVEPKERDFNLFSYSSQEGLNKVINFGRIVEPNLIPDLWRQELPEKVEVKWYNKNSSWWWLGGILLSASAAYFVERQLSQERAVGWQVRITGSP